MFVVGGRLIRKRPESSGDLTVSTRGSGMYENYVGGVKPPLQGAKLNFKIKQRDHAALIGVKCQCPEGAFKTYGGPEQSRGPDAGLLRKEEPIVKTSPRL